MLGVSSIRKTVQDLQWPDRVLLSTFMEEHWKKVGYQPDTDALNGVDDFNELEVQVGRKDTEPIVIPDSSLTGKYHSVIVKGFRRETSLESILDILSQHGLPAEYKREDIIQNEQSGHLTVENLAPAVCLSLVVQINGKRFLQRQIYVTAVVAESPVKLAPQSQAITTAFKSLPDQSAASPKPNSQSKDDLPPNLGVPLQPKPTPSPKRLSPEWEGFVFDRSPSVQEKINDLERKRKSEGSPEDTELSRKEKKILREGEKKQEKLRKKLEYKEKNQVKIQLQNSF